MTLSGALGGAWSPAYRTVGMLRSDDEADAGDGVLEPG